MKKKNGTEDDILLKLEQSFSKHFDATDDIRYFLSPSSIILLGDHTQYNDGLMISVSFNSYIGFALKKINKGFNIVFNDKNFYSSQLNEFDFPNEESLLQSLSNLFKHIAKEEIIKFGFECVIINNTSKVFGLGNHAAITMGFLKTMNTVFDINLSKQKLVDLAVKSETELYGKVISKPPYYSALSHKCNTLMYYDVRNNFKKFLPFDEKINFIVCNTNHAKKNFHERCKERIQECDIGVKGLRLYIWGIKNLRDVEEKFLERHIHMLPQRLYSRCLYNVIERKIVTEAYKNLRYKKFENFAQSLNETHSKLIELYDISSDTIDQLVHIAEKSNLSLGSKMISCSYHDSTINLVHHKNSEKFISFVRKNYLPTNNLELEIESYSISEGSKQIKQKSKINAN